MFKLKVTLWPIRFYYEFMKREEEEEEGLIGTAWCRGDILATFYFF